MTTNQIYSLVNSVNAQAFGSSALTATDTSSLIDLGANVLASNNNTEAFLNVLAQRIGRTILRFREYRNKLDDMVLNDFEYGAILQKIKIEMPTAEADQAYGLTNGASVDHYVVAKPDVIQKLFVTRTPYQYKITIQRSTLKEAFLNVEAMGAFIGTVFGEVRNAIEVSLENLGRITLATAIAEADGTARTIDLVSEFNSDNGTSLTATDAPYDPKFMAYAIARMNAVRDGMMDMSEVYNDGTTATFTPAEDMRVRINSKFHRMLESMVQYAAFHDELVEYDGKYTTINYWQAEQSPLDVNITRPSDQAATTVQNVVAIIADRDAMGIYKIDEEVSTTPLNAAGLYYNTFYHEKQLWFIDLSENCVVFTLN